jgi:spore germination cell wall hydrolase CwlJ-like protein
MNRAGGDASKVCSVVMQPHQFSWTSRLVAKRNGLWVLLKKGEPEEKVAWAVAMTVARLTLWGYGIDQAKGAQFYHARHVSPFWRRKFNLVAVIGDHLFYVGD